ncbi:MAG: hypothetical protein KKH98_07145 [Spirochaetes bacterium]|nr:hypothetical protein [Spirochaetota bacterium]
MRRRKIGSGVIRFEIPIESSSTSLSAREIAKLQQLAKRNGLSLRRYVALILKNVIHEETEKPLKMFT